jgi:ferric-dicitrate binding protein FerR (iron transport regulator)
MGSRPSEYDSHPPPADRIAWVARIAASDPHETDQDAQDAWSLLASREAIEQRMTSEIWARLAMRGIRIAVEDASRACSRRTA